MQIKTLLPKILKKTNNFYNMNLFSTKKLPPMQYCCKILVVGGGTAGCTMAAKCARIFYKHEIIVVEPEDVHLYKPGLTLVGAGVKQLRDIIKPTLTILPDNATWIQDAVETFCPANDAVILKSGATVHYQYMVIAMGIKPDFNKIRGLEKALINSSNVCTVYSKKYAEKTFRCFQEFTRGNAIFSTPAGVVACLGASLKICFLCSNYLRKRKQINDVTLIFASAKDVLFPIEVYEATLRKAAERARVDVQLETQLVEVMPEANKAIFACVHEPEKKICLKYSLLHVAAPMSPPDALKKCSELVTKTGFVDVDRKTLQHRKYMNVFAIGDCNSCQFTKTTSAVAVQTHIAFNNLMRVLDCKQPQPLYDGYTACPISTSYDSLMLAEYNYRLEPTPTFPFNVAKEKKWLFLLNAHVIPLLYWKFMLTGHWDGPEVVRKIFHFEFLKRKKSLS